MYTLLKLQYILYFNVPIFMIHMYVLTYISSKTPASFDIE